MPFVWEALRRAEKIGYLFPTDPYPRGHVVDTVLERLIVLVQHPIASWFGWHYCNLETCSQEQSSAELRHNGFLIANRCDSDILVPGNTTVYVAPALILHYILRHEYVPPSSFTEAVLACPEPGSEAYFAAIERICPAKTPQEFMETMAAHQNTWNFMRRFEIRRSQGN